MQRVNGFNTKVIKYHLLSWDKHDAYHAYRGHMDMRAHMVNIMPADALVTFVTRASVGTTMTHEKHIIFAENYFIFS